VTIAYCSIAEGAAGACAEGHAQRPPRRERLRSRPCCHGVIADGHGTKS
jgi:hypothetical protein